MTLDFPATVRGLGYSSCRTLAEPHTFRCAPPRVGEALRRDGATAIREVTVMHAAGEALHAAKHKGRNQAETAASGGFEPRCD
jgi:hypothetical protein